MRQRRVFGLAVCVLASVLAAGVPASAQDAPRPSEEEIVERIRELRRQIDELLSHLSSETRERLRRELAEPASTPAAEPPKEDAGAPDAAEPPGDPPPRRSFRRGRPACNTLDAFDTDRDGVVDALDRYWRYLYLWLDKNGDGEIDRREILSTYDRKVSEIATDLESFESEKAGRGEIRIGERILLDLRGNGFGSDDDAVLLVDASALGRGAGPTLLDGSGTEVEGVRAFEPEWRLRDSEGRVIRLTCP